MLRGKSLKRSLLTYQLYGANTDVGKTIFSTILCKTFERTAKTSYLKPVSTGPLAEADDQHVKTFATKTATKCLFQFGEAVSPHIAASGEVPSDSSIVDAVQTHLQNLPSLSPDDRQVVLIETAGGVHSPTPSGTSQADLYRPLRLPILLVGDPKLGGISSTICAYESLHLRGYDLDSVLVFEDEKFKNHEFLSKYFQERNIATTYLPPPPTRRKDPLEDKEFLSNYYESILSSGRVDELVHSSSLRHERRIDDLESMNSRAVSQIWYPFTQHKNLTAKKILPIDSAYGDYFQTLSPAPAPSPENASPSLCDDKGTPIAHEQGLLESTFDGSASWWTQGLGHGCPTLSLAAAYAAGRYGHVMFAGAVHEPALSLAELLLKQTQNPRLQKVFYSDNGSTGMEVAIKMALTASSRRYDIGADELGFGNMGIIGLKGSYHGDTIGAMDASDPGTYNKNVHWYRGRGHWFDFPQVSMKDGEWHIESPKGMEDVLGDEETFGSLNKIFDISRDNSARAKFYEDHIMQELTRLTKEKGRRFGAVVMEPLILGAGGMQFCDPLFQRTLVSVVRNNPQLFSPSSIKAPLNPEPHSWSGLPVIFDEVFTGLFRLGVFTPSSLLNTHPDISVYAKLLTGGLLPLCTTLASNSIYDAFMGDEKADALLHGHSYTAHAVGCNVARSSVQSILDLDAGRDWEAYKQDWAVSSDVGLAEDDTRLWSVWEKEFVSEISRKNDVESVIALGSVLAIKLMDEGTKGYSSNAADGLQARLSETDGEFTIHTRILGNVLYVMASLKSERESLANIQSRLIDGLK